jgi:hypothetical protein
MLKNLNYFFKKNKFFILFFNWFFFSSLHDKFKSSNFSKKIFSFGLNKKKNRFMRMIIYNFGKKSLFVKIFINFEKKNKNDNCWFILKNNFNFFKNFYLQKEKKVLYFKKSFIFLKFFDRKVQKKNIKRNINFFKTKEYNNFLFNNIKILLKFNILKKINSHFKKKREFLKLNENFIKNCDLNFFYFTLNLFKNFNFSRCKKKGQKKNIIEGQFFLLSYFQKFNFVKKSFFLFFYFFIFLIKKEGDLSTFFLLKIYYNDQLYFKFFFQKKFILLDEKIFLRLNFKIYVFSSKFIKILNCFLQENYYFNKFNCFFFSSYQEKNKKNLPSILYRFKKRIFKNLMKIIKNLIYKNFFLEGNFFFNYILAKENIKYYIVLNKNFYFLKTTLFKWLIFSLKNKEKFFCIKNFLIKISRISILIKFYLLLFFEESNMKKFTSIFKNYFFRINQQFFKKIFTKKYFFLISYILIGGLKNKIKSIHVYFKNTQKSLLKVLSYRNIISLNHFLISHQNFIVLFFSTQFKTMEIQKLFPVKKIKIKKNCILFSHKCFFFFFSLKKFLKEIKSSNEDYINKKLLKQKKKKESIIYSGEFFNDLFNLVRAQTKLFFFEKKNGSIKIIKLLIFYKALFVNSKHSFFFNTFLFKLSISTIFFSKLKKKKKFHKPIGSCQLCSDSFVGNFLLKINSRFGEKKFKIKFLKKNNLKNFNSKLYQKFFIKNLINFSNLNKIKEKIKFDFVNINKRFIRRNFLLNNSPQFTNQLSEGKEVTSPKLLDFFLLNVKDAKKKNQNSKKNLYLLKNL